MAVGRRWRALTAALGALALVATACGGDDGASDDAAEEPAVDASTEEEPAAEEPDPAEEDPDAAVEADEPSADAGGEVQPSITIGMNNPNYATQLPTILADEWGYFAEEGIEDIEILTTDDYIPGLIGGSLDITQGDTDVAIGSAAASGEGIVFLGTYRNNEYRILAGAEGIETPEDLVGGTVVTGTEGNRTYLATYGVIEALGLDPETDVEFVTTGGASDAWAQQLINGQVQGAAVFPRHISIIEEAGGNILYNEDFEVPQEGLIVMASFLEEERATVDAFLRATLRARQDLQDLDRRDEVFEIMRGRGFEIPEEFESAYELEIAQLSPDGGFDAALMDEFIDQQIELENLPADVDWREYVDVAPLHAAQESLGLESNPASLD